MSISKSYVDILRYVSANGKHSVMETSRKSAQIGKNVKYVVHTECKSKPIGMPEMFKGFSYDQWESSVLRYGETKSRALDGWFKIIMPSQPKKVKLTRVQEEITKNLTKENIDKIEFFKTLSSKEREVISENAQRLCKRIETDTMGSDDMQLLAILSGYKPAYYCAHGFDGKINFNKIKLNPKIADKFDVVKMPPDGELYFLNKPEVLKIIEANKDVYCGKLGLKQSENAENIYETLLQAIQYKIEGHALFGMTLGFPRHSSMIFELSSFLKNKVDPDIKKNIPLFKEKLLELLHSNKSPFQRCSKETILKLEEHIKAMESSDSVHSSIYYFRTYGNEEKAVQKILKQAEDFDKNFKVENLM